MAQLQAFWNRLNTNERLVGYGIIVILVSWLIGVLGGVGFVTGGAVVPAIIVGVIYWLKYNSTTPVAWPLPVQTFVLIIAGIEALFALVGLLAIFGTSPGPVIFFLIAILGNAVGAGLMVYGAWKEYEAAAATAPPAPPAG
jgi:hypothetical protein